MPEPALAKYARLSRPLSLSTLCGATSPRISTYAQCPVPSAEYALLGRVRMAGHAYSPQNL